MTYFAVLIENEIANVMTIPEGHKLDTILRNNPLVVNITDFSYTPPDGAIWNGESFDVSEDFYPLPSDPYKEIYGENTYTFAYVVNNICVGRTRFYNNFSSGEGIIAAYQSNPAFADITNIMENSGYVSTSDVLGMYLVDGKIVSE